MNAPAQPVQPVQPVQPLQRPPLKSLDDALAQLLTQAQPQLGTEPISTFDADGRVLAQDAVSALQVPPHDNSSMDGYALRCMDVPHSGVELPLTQRIAAGASGTPLQSGSVARIFTGAPIPAGADAVVMQEDCALVSGSSEAGVVRINVMPKPGQWIRRAGEDVSRGAIVLSKGKRLTAADIGLAASIGLATLTVAKRPRVALFSTGDELVMPGDVAPVDMKPGAIYNSNRFFLRALLQRFGCDVTDFGIVPDRREATFEALREASKHHDLILTSGGVSVGEEDHIKPAVEALGELNLWQIAMKPGKPFAYGRIGGRIGGRVEGRVEGRVGTQERGAHFIGLPGNPVSSFVTFLLLVRPFLLRLQGVADVAVKSSPLPAHFNWPKPDKRREFLRVRRNAAGALDLFPNQSSGVLTSAVWADGLVDLPSGQTVAHGDLVRFIALSDLLS
jgi:molybdopterin molybdotransferase